MNIALIGFGYWGPNVAKHLFNNNKINLSIICDSNELQLEKAKQIYVGQTSYKSNYEELLNDKSIDAVAIAVETSSHFIIAKKALLAGKHIYVEKPFTSNVQEAKELERIAIDNNLIIHVNHIMLYHPIIKKIKSIIASGELGELIYVDSTRLNLGQIKKDVSAMWDLAVHDLAIIDFISNGEGFRDLNVMGDKRYSPKESLVFLSIRYNSFIANIQSNWISPVKERRLIIVGTKKMIVFDDMKMAEKLIVYDKGVSVISGENPQYDDYVIRTREGSAELPYVEFSDALYNSIDHFLNCIENQTESISGPNQAIRMLEILMLASKSFD